MYNKEIEYKIKIHDFRKNSQVKNICNRTAQFYGAFRYVTAASAPYSRLYSLPSHPTGYILFCETLMCVQYNRIRNLALPPETYRLAH